MGFTRVIIASVYWKVCTNIFFVLRFFCTFFTSFLLHFAFSLKKLLFLSHFLTSTIIFINNINNLYIRHKKLRLIYSPSGGCTHTRIRNLSLRDRVWCRRDFQSPPIYYPSLHDFLYCACIKNCFHVYSTYIFWKARKDL